jgi:hypothetical protein
MGWLRGRSRVKRGWREEKEEIDCRREEEKS